MSITAPPRTCARRVLSLALLACLLSLPFLPDGLPSLIRPDARAAAAFTVNSTADAPDSNTGDNLCNDGAGNCTLRAAIQQANATAGADTISFSVTGTINLTGALPDINTDMTISGPGSGQLTVRRSTGGDYRVFTVFREVNFNNLIVGISGLTVMNGRTAAGAAGNLGGNGGHGGGLLNNGRLTMSDVVVTANSTGVGGPGVTSGGNGGAGGGIFNAGTLTLTNCVVSGNSTGVGGDGNNGAGNGGDGGGILSANTLTLTNTVVSGNSTGSAGNTSGIGRTGGRGGGLYSEGGLATLTGVVISNNTAGGGGVGSPGNPGFGGHGGGIYFDSGAATLTNSTVSGNTAGPSQSGTPGYGGGIENSAALTVLNSTISGNAGNAGGAVLNRLALNMTNSTVSGNRLTTGAGGAINNSDSNSTLRLTNCTLTANDGPAVLGGNSPAVRNTIIAGNGGTTDVTGSFNSQGHNIIGRGDSGAQTGFSHGVNGDQVGTIAAPIDPRLGPLADNGGPTLTHALLADSPALDAGNNALALDASNNPLTTDQRGPGFPRIADSADPDTVQTVDVGAFEAAHPIIEDVSDKTTPEDTPLSFSFNVGDAALGIASVTATSSNQALVPDSNLSISGTGSTRTLQITPAANLSGTATITLTVTGSNGRSMSDTFVLTVTAVNDAPSFTKGADQTVAEDSGAQTVSGWATGISAGPPDESGQVVSFLVTSNTNPGLFSVAPSVSPGGTLTYTPAANANGGATITLVARDNGGTAGGGQDTSAAQTFTINVTAVNDAPVNSVPAAQTTGRNTPLVFSSANSNAVSVSDVDSGDALLTLSAANGTLTLGTRTGLAFISGDGIDDATMSFTGTLANVNAALNGLTFKPADGFTGTASVQITTDDQGNTGSGGARADTDAITVNVLSGGSLQLSAAASEITEAGGVATFTVTRAGGSAGATSVSFSTSGGTATAGAACSAGVDYVSASGTLNWADGETAAKTFTVTLCDDSAREADETVGVTLSNAAGSATLGTPSSATLTIRDDDPAGGRVEFGQSSFTARENSGGVTVTVRRTGETGAAVTVDYTTDDGSTPTVAVPCSSTTGLALERCDYTRAVGRLHFAAGETEKTFQVLFTDDSYVEGTETATLRLSNPGGGAALGQRAAAMLEITDDVPETSGNPNDDSEKFVRQHYHDFFSREPDAPGLAHWTNVIESCGSDQQCREVRRINVSAAFFLSIEFKETGYLVERLYKSAYGDAIGISTLGGIPHQLQVPIIRLEEFLPDTQQIGRGVVVHQPGWEALLESNKVAFTREFVERQRFVNSFPLSMAPAQFVDRLNERAGRPLDASERQALIDELTANNTTAGRASVLRKVAEDPTLEEAEKNRAFVLMQYFGYLRRNPNDAPDADHTGYDFWLGNLNRFNGNFVQAELVKAFITSIEYRRRFGQ